MNRISEALLTAAQKISSIQSAHFDGSYNITSEILERVAKEIDNHQNVLDEVEAQENLDAMVTRLMDLRYIELKHTVTRMQESEERYQKNLVARILANRKEQ